MNMLISKWLIAAVAAVGLVACGGGGGNARSPAATANSPAGAASGAVAAVTVGSLAFTLDKTSITNSGSDKALLTVTALDTSRNVVKGVPMSVTLDSGSYAAVVSTTNDLGQASGYISIGGNKTNRTITATYTVGGVAGTASVAVVGSSISITVTPSIPAPGDSVSVAIKVFDTNGAVIPFVNVALSGTFLGIAQSINTGQTGIWTVSQTASLAADYTIGADGSGIKASTTVHVVAPGAPTVVPDVTATIASSSLSINPTTIYPNTVGSTTNRATLKALFVDTNNNPIQNVRARFEIASNSLGLDEKISTLTNTTYSDATGVATADYIPGVRSSPTDGVSIKVCYGQRDIDIASGACPASVTSTLTVAGQPLSISIGDNNKLVAGNGGLTYIKQFDIAVADAAGLAVQNALVSASVDITQYGKGLFSMAVTSYPAGSLVTSPPDRNADAYLYTVISTADPSVLGTRIWCPNEDRDRDGLMDKNPIDEDTNGDGSLTPRKAEIVLSYVATNQTNTTGRLLLQVEYPQNVATWLAYTIKVSTSVLGSEGTAFKAYVTDFLKDDLPNGSFLTPPYGIGKCTTPQ
jgi:hypothetical protein